MLHNWIDIAIICIVVLSALISVIRGFVREAMSLAVWIIAFWLSARFANDVGSLLIGQISSNTTRTVIAFCSIFILVLIIGAIVSYLFSLLVEKTGIGGTDRLLGIIFGVLRGVLVVAVLLLLAQYTHLPKTSTWQSAKLRRYAQPIADQMQGFMQKHIKNYFPKTDMSFQLPKTTQD